MLVILSIITVILASTTVASGAENGYVHCQIEGDPRIAKFTLDPNANLTKEFCALRNAPIVLFRNKFIRIEVVNNGSSMGDIVSFLISILEDSDADDDVCIFTEQYFKSKIREYRCGSASISINQRYMEIEYENAELSVEIRSTPYTYNIDIWTTWENANKSRGLCRDGCTVAYTTNTRSLPFSRPVPNDQTTSLLAEKICDIYLKDYIKSNSQIPLNMIQFVEITRQGCIIDVSTMGDKKYAEQALASIVSTVMTSKALSLEQIHKRIQQAAQVVNNLSKIADKITAQLIAGHKTKN